MSNELDRAIDTVSAIIAEMRDSTYPANGDRAVLPVLGSSVRHWADRLTAILAADAARGEVAEAVLKPCRTCGDPVYAWKYEEAPRCLDCCAPQPRQPAPEMGANNSDSWIKQAVGKVNYVCGSLINNRVVNGTFAVDDETCCRWINALNVAGARLDDLSRQPNHAPQDCEKRATVLDLAREELLDLVARYGNSRADEYRLPVACSAKARDESATLYVAIAAALAAKPSAPEGPLTGKYGDVLRPFVLAMEKELHANAGKGDRPGWLKMRPEIALLEIYYHLSKLQKAVKDDNGPGIMEYSADVANMSMMLLDICGGLDLIALTAAQQQAGGDEG